MKNSHRIRSGIVYVAALTAIALRSAGAAALIVPVTISTSDDQLQNGADNQGWISDTALQNNLTNDNYVAGFIGVNEYRNYFFFALEPLSDLLATDVTLEARRYESFEGETIEFFDVSTPPAELIETRNGTINQSAFQDLGSGVLYGSFTLGAGEKTDILSFSLNAAAVADLNAAIAGGDEFFAIGGRVATDGRVFGASSDEPGNSSDNNIQQIVVNTTPIPEPSAVLLSLLATALLFRRRRG